MTDETRIDTVRLQAMSRAFINSASLFAAIDIGLFTAIANGANTPAEVAAKTETSELNAERIMTMCAAAGLLEWRDGKYVNAPDVARFLVEGESRYAGAWLQFLRPDWEKWGQLTKSLRTETPAQITPRSVVGMTVEQARRYHKATSSVGFGAGRRFARDVDLSARSKLLDLGGGSGAYSIVATEHNGGLRAIVFDLPAVVEVTREFIADHKATERVEAVAGDFTLDDFPAGCDAVVMASNLPMYGRDVMQTVIDKAFAVLEPGGEMHLVGEMLDDDRAGPTDAAIWGLAEALANSTGRAHTRGECVEYFRTAGFENVQIHEFIPGVLTRVAGTKPV
jgi:ubiquinone/menaquinone biosynthesis C-methylase UbiE